PGITIQGVRRTRNSPRVTPQVQDGTTWTNSSATHNDTILRCESRRANWPSQRHLPPGDPSRRNTADRAWRLVKPLHMRPSLRRWSLCFGGMSCCDLTSDRNHDLEVVA